MTVSVPRDRSAGAAEPPPPQGDRRTPDHHALVSRWAPPLVALLVGLALWQLVIVLELGQLPLPSPWDVAYAAYDFGTSGEFWSAALESGRVLVQGFVPGVVLAVAVGMVVGQFDLLDRGVGPLLFAVYTTPFIALIPLLLILFGFGVTGKTMIVFFLVWITVVLQTVAGVRNVDDKHVEVARAFRSPRFREILEVTFPAALPFIVAGIRLGIGRALVGVVVAEFETAVTGLGGVILLKAQQLELAEAFIPALFLGGVGVVLTSGLRRWEGRLQAWKQ